MSHFTNKVAIITGSTSGIGKAIACQLSKLGTKVVINSAHSTEKGKALANRLPNAIYVQGNIGNEEDCQQLVNRTIEQFGQCDILVNNAGQSFRNPDDEIFEISNQAFSQILSTNVVGTWCLTRYALPYLKQSGDGNIINITSCAGIDPASASSGIPYSVAKAALNHLTLFLAKHAGPQVRANAIAPGLIITPRTENFTEAVEKFESRTPLKRTGKPEDIAEIALAIIRSDYINGEIIRVDGGFSTY